MQKHPFWFFLVFSKILVPVHVVCCFLVSFSILGGCFYGWTQHPHKESGVMVIRCFDAEVSATLQELTATLSLAWTPDHPPMQK